MQCVGHLSYGGFGSSLFRSKMLPYLYGLCDLRIILQVKVLWRRQSFGNLTSCVAYFALLLPCAAYGITWVRCKLSIVRKSYEDKFLTKSQNFQSSTGARDRLFLWFIFMKRYIGKSAQRSRLKQPNDDLTRFMACVYCLQVIGTTNWNLAGCVVHLANE